MRGIAGGLAGAVVGGLAAGLAGKLGIGYAASTISALPVALGVGIGTGASTRFTGGFAGGLVGGFAAGLLEGVGKGLTAGIINGLGVGVAAGLAVGVASRQDPAARLRWDRVGIIGGLAAGVAVGVVAWREEGSSAGLVLGALVGITCSWPLGLIGSQEDLQAVPTPRTALTRDSRTFRTTALGAGIAAVAAGFFGGGLASVFEVKAKATLFTVLADGLGIGLASGLVLGLIFGIYHAASPNFLITRIWFSLRRQLPWRLMEFLADAHEKHGVLRQSGAFYQFRHLELQHRLARYGTIDREVLP